VIVAVFGVDGGVVWTSVPVVGGVILGLVVSGGLLGVEGGGGSGGMMTRRFEGVAFGGDLAPASAVFASLLNRGVVREFEVGG
jgi:hypothetical protein